MEDTTGDNDKGINDTDNDDDKEDSELFEELPEKDEALVEKNLLTALDIEEDEDDL